jgi:hypothetical protein
VVPPSGIVRVPKAGNNRAWPKEPNPRRVEDARFEVPQAEGGYAGLPGVGDVGLGEWGSRNRRAIFSHEVKGQIAVRAH